ncbi:unnamed protein product [Prorocentrum cordatum]|uniref:Uncharacterized protein n=1 Tax=Prorocentrum cordatum TaxID=2364126 RepID=A0ABN9Y371_9DINO|nr:unnamed protein product [Polarella glacialis]
MAVATAGLNKYDDRPFFRAALVATSLVSEKVVDGIAKLICRTDVEKSKGKDETIQLNSTLKRAWKLADQGVVHQTAFDMLVGKFMVRAVLFHFDKKHFSPDKKVYENMDDIKSRFANDLKRAAGDSPVDLGDFDLKVGDRLESATAARPEMERIGALTFDEMAAPPRVLKDRAGIEIGSHMKENNINENTLFEVNTAENDGTVTMTEASTFNVDECLKVAVGYKVLMNDWKVVKEKVSEECTGKDNSSEVLEQYQLRRMVFGSLRDEHIDLRKSGARCQGPPILCMKNPCGVVTSEAVGNDIFKFAPTAPLQNIICNKRKGAEGNSATAASGEKTMWATSVSKPADDTVAGCMAPYLWVESTTVEEKASGKFVKVVGADGVSYPALQNFKPLKVHERLYFFKPRDVTQA